MLPSDMLLKPLNQVVEGYNDKIVLNTSGHALGRVIPQVKKALPQAETGFALPLTRPLGDAHAETGFALPLTRPLGDHISPLEAYNDRLAAQHEQEKMALTLGLVGLALFAIWCS